MLTLRMALVGMAVSTLLMWSNSQSVAAETPPPNSDTNQPRQLEEFKPLRGLDNTPKGGTLPGGTLPGGTLPGGTLPGGTLPGGTLPGGTLPSPWGNPSGRVRPRRHPAWRHVGRRPAITHELDDETIHDRSRNSRDACLAGLG